jgi:hypothetical protein
MASDADVLAQGRLETLRRQHGTMVVGLFWGAVVLALLTAWLAVRHWQEARPVVVGAAVLTLAALALAVWQLRAGFAAGREPGPAEAALRRQRRPVAFVVFLIAGVLLLLLLWLATQQGWLAVFPEFLSGVVVALVGLGAGALLLLEPGVAFSQERVLQNLAALRQPLLVGLLVVGAGLVVLGIVVLVTQGPREAFPEIAGSGLLGLLLVGAGLYLLLTPGTALTPANLRVVVLTVGGLAGLVVAVLTVLRALLWWNEYFAAGVTAWRGEGAWRLWVCFYVELLGLAVIFGSLLLARADIRVNPVMRRLLFGYNTALTGLLLLAALVVFNVTVYAWYPYTFEWTKTRGLYSLSDKSKATLEGLKEPVTVYVTMSQRTPDFIDVRTLLQNVQTFTNKVRVEYISPDLQVDRYEALLKKFPKLAQEKRAGGARGVLVVYGPEGTKTTPPNAFIPEASLSGTRAGPERGENEPPGFLREFKGESLLMTELRFLAKGGVRPAVYFTQGSREPDLADVSTRRGTGLLAKYLRDQRYEVRGLVWGAPPPGAKAAGALTAYSQKDLDAPHEVPADAMAVVIVQPQVRYPKGALDALRKYLDGKGKLLVLTNPLAAPPSFTLIETGLEDLLAKYGVELGKGYILHLNPSDPREPPFVNRAIVSSEGKNPLAAFQDIVFTVRTARTVRPQTGAGAYRAETILEVPLLNVQPIIWSESDLRTMRDPEVYVRSLLRDPQELVQKASRDPLPVGVAVKDGKDQPTLVAFGDATLAYNERAQSEIYAALLSSSLEWLAGRPENIGIEPRKTNFFTFRREVSIPGMVFLPAGLIALGLLGVGAGVWVVRRR